MKPGFTAQLYLRDDAGYSEQRKVSASGIVAERCQLLRFEVPAGAKGLRLDPAERPGFMHVQAIRLLRDGQLAWDWRSDTEGWRVLAACPHHQMVFSAFSAPPGGLMLLCGDDPWVELPVASETLAGTVDLQLEVELGFAVPAEISPLSGSCPSGAGRSGLAIGTRPCVGGPAGAGAMLHTRSTREVRGLAREKAALQRKLAGLQGLPPSVQPIAATVDVVVPVYLNLEETRRCIEAVLSSAVRTPWRLVVVNDASPEPDLTDWLREFAARDARLSSSRTSKTWDIAAP